MTNKAIWPKSVLELTPEQKRISDDGYAVEREHPSRPHEIFAELERRFAIVQRRFLPLRLPAVWANLVIGLTLRPK
jgi:hypothetical protein